MSDVTADPITASANAIECRPDSQIDVDTMQRDAMSAAQGADQDDTMDFLREKRAEAMSKVTRHQFYQSDCVKNFNRKLLLTEAVKGWEEQIEMKRQKEAAAKDETKQLKAESGQWAQEAVERERDKVRQRERDQAAASDCLRQQLQKQQLKMNREKGMEAAERKRLREAEEREKAELQKRKQVEKVCARQAHEHFMAERKAIQAQEAQRQQMEEERRKVEDEEREERVRKREREEMDRRMQLQRNRQDLAEKLAAQLPGNALHRVGQDAGTSAQDVTTNAELEREQQEKAERRAMLQALDALRIEECRERKKREEEERKIGRDTLRAHMEADFAHWHEHQQNLKKKREERCTVDEVLRQQMAEKCAGSQRGRSERVDYARKNAQLLAEEEKQFQRYTSEVIDAATKNKYDTRILRKGAKQVEVTGLGPITGGLRAGYLTSSDPAHAKVPDYISTTNEDIKNLYANPGVQNNRRWDFRW